MKWNSSINPIVHDTMAESVQQGHLSKAEELPNDKKLYIPLDQLGVSKLQAHMKHVIIATTNQTIVDGINGIKGDVRTMTVIAENITKYSAEEFERIYTEQEQEWQDFCDDAVLFAIYRQVFLGKPIPVSLEIIGEERAQGHKKSAM